MLFCHCCALHLVGSLWESAADVSGGTVRGLNLFACCTYGSTYRNY